MGAVELCDEFSHRQCATILDLRIAAASLSVAGCTFILASIWLFRKAHNFAQRLLMWLTIAALLDSIPYFFGSQHPDDGPFCDFQAFWVSFFDWVVLLWICALTFYMHALILWQWDTSNHERRYHAVVWGLALVPAIVPLCTRGYAPAGAWCWIEQSQTALRFALWYVPMLLLLAVIGVSYVLMYRRLRSRQFSLRGEAIQEEDDSYRDNIATLKWYPVVYVVVSVFSVINRIQNAVHPSHPVYALYLLHSLSSPLQGLFNAAVYATSVASLRSTSFQSIKQALSHRLASPEMQEYTVHQPDEEGLMANTSSDSEADLLP